jgi:hypothetical protein
MVSAIGQVAGAASTVGAVIVSLHLARRSERPSIRLRCRLATKRPGSPEACYIDIAVANTGTRKERITSIGWKVRRRGSRKLIFKPSIAHSEDILPYSLEVGHDAQFAWSHEDYAKQKESLKNWIKENRKFHLIYPRARIFVTTASGFEISSPVSHRVQLMFATGNLSMFELHELRVLV